MAFRQSGGIRYYQFDSFDQPAITHAIFTRQGGLSPKPWDSLNVGGLIGDESQRVIQNRVLSFQSVGRDPASVYDVWQVHSAETVCTDSPRPPDVDHLKADAILTDNPRVTLFMRFADCVPILLFDPVRRVVGLVHAGWQGTVKKIASAAVKSMTDCYGSAPADLVAGIGPSIGAHHYPIGPEVADQVHQVFGETAGTLLPSDNGAVQFDLWRANQLLLTLAGVVRIEVSGLCTACHPEDWYSHRGEKGKTGRFGALIGLNHDD